MAKEVILGFTTEKARHSTYRRGRRSSEANIGSIPLIAAISRLTAGDFRTPAGDKTGWTLARLSWSTME